ncbi:MAG: ORF6N domain-containing protein [Arcobacteraceae bacterium]
MNDLTTTTDTISHKIHTIRGLQVMLDRDLAELYGVETKALNQAVKRNEARFPSDFRFQLSSEEFENLRSQIVTLENGRGKHRKYLPYVFTEQGVV